LCFYGFISEGLAVSVCLLFIGLAIWNVLYLKDRINCIFFKEDMTVEEKLVNGKSSKVMFDGNYYNIDITRTTLKFKWKGVFPAWMRCLIYQTGNPAPLDPPDCFYTNPEFYYNQECDLNDIKIMIEKSSKEYAKYISNLDKLLGVKTVLVPNDFDPLVLVSITNNKCKELRISKEYNWYILDKKVDAYVFKVCGIHKKDKSKNVAYLLGIDEENNKPKLVQINFSDDRPIDKIIAGKW
jgi:hypothetical protein